MMPSDTLRSGESRELRESRAAKSLTEFGNCESRYLRESLGLAANGRHLQLVHNVHDR